MADSSSFDSQQVDEQPVVLVIEDEPDVREILCALLEMQYHFHVVFASTGAEAHRMALQHNPDLILLDLMLDDMDGWDVARQIRQEAALASTPIIVVSEHCWETEVRQRAEDAGCNCCINKANILDELPSLIQKYMKAV